MHFSAYAEIMHVHAFNINTENGSPADESIKINYDEIKILRMNDRRFSCDRLRIS